MGFGLLAKIGDLNIYLSNFANNLPDGVSMYDVSKYTLKKSYNKY